MTTHHTPQFMSALRIGLVSSFDIAELRVLCMDLDVDYENLGGSGKSAKILQLILYMQRRQDIPKLLGYCVSSRPDYPWPDVNTKKQELFEPRTLEWNHQLSQEFHACLLNAFDRDSLARMLRFSLDKDLNAIVGSGNFSTMAFDLIEVARRQGWILTLVRTAHETNSGNERLAAFAMSLA